MLQSTPIRAYRQQNNVGEVILNNIYFERVPTRKGSDRMGKQQSRIMHISIYEYMFYNKHW